LAIGPVTFVEVTISALCFLGGKIKQTFVNVREIMILSDAGGKLSELAIELTDSREACLTTVIHVGISDLKESRRWRGNLVLCSTWESLAWHRKDAV
jgi:hypothetical protein